MSKVRNILVVSHTAQPDSLEACVEVCHHLREAGVTAVLRDTERDAVAAAAPDLSDLAVLGDGVDVADLECAIVLGGDGTILRAAEALHGVDVPLVGINLGRVGFLAEAERSGMNDTVARVLAGDYTVEKRSTLDVRVFEGDKQVFETWALNEAAIEKIASRMLEVVIGVDQRPLSSFGCDGVVVATPTGSTAYAFSAGGPVVWPTVSAMVLVPLSAHALFARPLVTAPTSTIVVEIEAHSAPGILTCDGRRTLELAPGARIVITTSDVAITLARVHNESFTERLVNKFDLPVTGWRGPGGVGRE